MNASDQSPEEWLKAMTKAVNEAPESLEAWFNLHSACANVGRWEDSVKAYGRYIELCGVTLRQMPDKGGEKDWTPEELAFWLSDRTAEGIVVGAKKGAAGSARISGTDEDKFVRELVLLDVVSWIDTALSHFGNTPAANRFVEAFLHFFGRKFIEAGVFESQATFAEMAISRQHAYAEACRSHDDGRGLMNVAKKFCEFCGTGNDPAIGDPAVRSSLWGAIADKKLLGTLCKQIRIVGETRKG